MMNSATSESDLVAMADTLSNWGRWGPADVLGTLNLISDGARLAAFASVSAGSVVSCALPLNIWSNPDGNVSAGGVQAVATRRDLSAPDGPTVIFAAEELHARFHGYEVTHLDAFSHVQLDGTTYNGDTVAPETISVASASHQIVGRGVLLDVPRFRGVRWLEVGEPVLPDEIDQILEAQGVTPQPGDMLLLRTGYDERRADRGGDAPDAGRAGWHASCLPWFAEHDISLIAADTANDVKPSGFDSLISPVHTIALARMGLWLLDNCDLRSLGDACAAHQRWSFLFMVAPLAMTGSTSSAVNPLAVF